MKKTLIVLLAATLLLTSCNTLRSVPSRMEFSTVLLKMKVHETIVDPDTGEKKEKSGWGVCSGVYIKPNIILSAAHCVDMPEDLTLKEIWMQNNYGESVKAFVVKLDTKADLVLLYTPIEGIPVKFAYRAIRGEDCWIIGNPLGLRDIVTKGIVSQIGLVIKGEKATFLVVDAVALPGNSGGAIVDSHGRLIGILTRSTSMFGSFGASGLGIGVDLETIRKFLRNK